MNFNQSNNPDTEAVKQAYRETCLKCSYLFPAFWEWWRQESGLADEMSSAIHISDDPTAVCVSYTALSCALQGWCAGRQQTANREMKKIILQGLACSGN